MVDDGWMKQIVSYDEECMEAVAGADIEAWSKSGELGGMKFEEAVGDKSIGVDAEICVYVEAGVKVKGFASVK